MGSVIEAEHLGKRFDSISAVSDVTFAIDEGSILALLGPNGAGKTTTVRMLTSILRPTSGVARVAGHDVVLEARRVRSLVGHLTEFPGLYLRMRALEYLDFFGELHGMTPSRCRARARELLEQFGLTSSLNLRLGEYSKGMRQKVALIRALLHQPRVLFLDEPTSAMDPHSANQVRNAIALLRASGQTVLLCTHNLHEADMLADRIAIIQRGKLLALGTGEELKQLILGPAVTELRLTVPLGMPWPDLNGNMQVLDHNELYLRYTTRNPEITNPLLLGRLNDLKGQVLSLSEMPRSLEDVYLRLMGEQDLAREASGQDFL